MVNSVTIMSRPLRVALLSYRSKAHCGGQGVYIRHLSRELAALGHTVEVLSGQPYPELEPGPVLRKVPSLDLYRDEDPFRTPARHEYRDWIDVLETVTMWTGAFPEPLTFSLRALRELRARRADFDVVHDNQGLGYGLLGVDRLGLPLVTTIHHPISVDRRIELAATRGLARLSRRRWYSFVRMQARVARRVAKAGPVITVSESSRRDIYRDFRLPPGKRGHHPARRRHARLPSPRGRPRARPDRHRGQRGLPGQGRGRAAAGGRQARHRAGRAAHRGRQGGRARRDRAAGGRAVARDRVRFTPGLPEAELAALLASAEIAVVPSLYEGFSLPAVEHMASGTPLVASRAGALPEVTGDAAELVTPGDAEELAAALRRLHDSPRERDRLSGLAWRRVQAQFAWPAVAQATADCYARAIAAHRARER